MNNRTWLVAFVLVVFSAGVATGVLVGEYLRPAPAMTEARPFPPHLIDRLADLLADELALTSAQRTALDAIVNERREKMAALRADMRGRFERDASDLTRDIQEILTLEQRQKFDDVIARVRAKFLDGHLVDRPHQP